MDRKPFIMLGSPLGQAPTVRLRANADSLLQQFGSDRSPTSVTKARKLASASPPKQPARQRSSTPSRRSPRQQQSGTPARSDSPSARSTPRNRSQSRGTPRKTQTPQPPTTPIIVDEQTQELKMETRTRSGRVSRPSNVILDSDTIQNSPRKTPSRKPARVSDTARARVREKIATETGAMMEKFILAHKDYFLPLLPHNNFVSKLEAKYEGQNTSIAEYSELQEQPKGVMATMKPYQLSGLSFLAWLHNNGMAGILGDEMGLGKTLQTLSLLQYLEEQDQLTGTSSEVPRPYLVVCPLSVLGSWVAEAQRWTPGLPVLALHGSKSERTRLKKVATGVEDTTGQPSTEEAKKKTSFKIMVTTYETFQSERDWFKRGFVWRYIVLDEGHRIKNSSTLAANALQTVPAEYRLILTGTPLQNNLHEMWALLHWLYPDVFVSNTDGLFKKSFDLSRGQVNTTVLDHARRLLEVVMLRRMKNSPGVNLGLPPKEEVLLYVPLTPMQRFWYTRLLTRVEDAMFQDLFSDVTSKEKQTLSSEAQESSLLSKLQQHETASSEQSEWHETATLMQQALNEEQTEVNATSAWKKLMNLVLQLRKCCSHPYLLPGAVPAPYTVGEHVIRASGKFIVLEKLLRHKIFDQDKKVLIFSSFTQSLDCAEDLLSVIGGSGQSFRFLRLDGSTSRARRNLEMRMFNDPTSDYKVMLLSVRAGGLGINLTAASDVIFLDEDWNPQITLQAEARAHRIGQTNPVTIYKLCTQGTVEEQMMGRIRKKLYLSTKITETMRNIHGDSVSAAQSPTDEVPQLGTSQLKSLVRRGAQTLSHPEIDVTEMLSWDIDTMLEKCRDKPADCNLDAETSDADEQKWLSAMERVECAVFDGKRYQRSFDSTSAINILPSEVTRDDRRKGKNTTVMVDGFAVTKDSLNCAQWEAVSTKAGKDPRLAEPKREKKPDIQHENHCLVCFEPRDENTVDCSHCPRAFHYNCLAPEFQATAGRFRGLFCPQHQCVHCHKRSAEAGGLIYRCRWCEKGYCESCLDWDSTVLIGDTLPEFEVMLERPSATAFYIKCHQCISWTNNDEGAAAWMKATETSYKMQHAAYVDALDANQRVYEQELETYKKRKAQKLAGSRTTEDGSTSFSDTLGATPSLTIRSVSTAPTDPRSVTPRLDTGLIADPSPKVSHKRDTSFNKRRLTASATEAEPCSVGAASKRPKVAATSSAELGSCATSPLVVGEDDDAVPLSPAA